MRILLLTSKRIGSDLTLTLRLLMSQAARLLRSWVRIPPGAWIFVCCDCRVLSGRGLCDELITRPEEPYRLCCVVVCDLETSRMGAPYIYDISHLRVNLFELHDDARTCQRQNRQNCLLFSLLCDTAQVISATKHPTNRGYLFLQSAVLRYAFAG